MRERYTVQRQSLGGHFYIYDTKAGLTTPVGQFEDGTLAYDVCLMLNNREAFWFWNTSNQRNKRQHAGMGAHAL